MRRPVRWTFLAALAGLLVGFAALAWWLAPRVVAWEPAGGLLGPQEPLAVVTSRPLRAGGVASYLRIEPEVEGIWRSDGRRLLFEPAQAWAYDQEFTVRLAAGAPGPGILPVLRPATYSFQVRPPQLLFLREESGRVNLWVRDGQGHERPLTDEALGVWDYAAEPSGQGVIVSALDGDGSDDLLWLGLDGQRQVLLACDDSQCRSGRSQPGGDLLAYERRRLGATVEETEIWLLDRQSGRLAPALGETILEQLPGSSARSRFPRWSADGRRLAVYQPDLRLIVVLEMNSAAAPLLIPANLELMGDWSPTSERLAYTELAYGIGGPHTHVVATGQVISHTETALYEHLVVSDLAGRETIDLSSEMEGSDGLPSWSPDGRQLALSRSLDGSGRQLWLVSAADGDGRPLTDDPFLDHSAVAWSPDGGRLTFMRRPLAGSTEPPSIWLLDLPDGRPALVVENGFLPAWLP